VRSPYNNDVDVRRAAEGNDANLSLRERICQRSYRWIEDPISSVVSAQDLRLGTAKDMLQSYYWSHTFKFSGRVIFLLVPFLKTKMFGLEIIPALYVRRLHIELHSYIWALFNLPGIRRIEEQIYFSTIETLDDASTSLTEITLNIKQVEDMEDDIESVVMSEKAKRRIGHTVQNLRGRCLRIRIIYSQTWDG
jgi:hypothetical protein